MASIYMENYHNIVYINYKSILHHFKHIKIIEDREKSVFTYVLMIYMARGDLILIKICLFDR